MSTIIIAVALFAVAHYIYEAVIAPSIRLHLRNRLFILRDELRRLKIDGLDMADEEAFHLVHDGINNLLTRLPQLTLANTIALQHAYAMNEELRSKVDGRVAVVRACENRALTVIFEKANEVIESAFIANMGGWFFYLVPIALLIVAFKRLANLAAELIATPVQDTERLFSANSCQPA